MRAHTMSSSARSRSAATRKTSGSRSAVTTSTPAPRASRRWHWRTWSPATAAPPNGAAVTGGSLRCSMRGCCIGAAWEGADMNQLAPIAVEEEAPLTAEDELWFRDAIIYQLHVKAFADSNHDGIGDFPGLTDKLDYLQD